MEIAIAIVAFILGCIVSKIVFDTRLKNQTFGTIKVHDSDPDEPPYLFLELRTNVSDVMSQKVVTFRVSQK